MTTIKKIIQQVVKSDRAWNLINTTVIRTAEYARVRRQVVEDGRVPPAAPSVSDDFFVGNPDLTVKHGPFRGMRYPGRMAVGSTLVPKIIGCYERELHAVVETICANSYDIIVDIGSAEGYYAVGLALRIPQSIVFAFDCDSKAIQQCEIMAQINDIAERVLTGTFCSEATLSSLPLGRKALIISDCEGYEKELFTVGFSSSLCGA